MFPPSKGNPRTHPKHYLNWTWWYTISEMEGQKFKVILNYTVSFKDILKICFTLYILAMRSLIEAWDTPVSSVVSRRSADGSPNRPWLDTGAEQTRLEV